MPLMPTTHAAIDAFEEISFLMVDGERLVRVDVHRAVVPVGVADWAHHGAI